MFRIPAISLALVLLTTATQAQSPTANVHQACAADYARICGSLPRGERKGCMRGHLNDVSPDCKSAIMARRAANRSAHAAAPANETPPGDETSPH